MAIRWAFPGGNFCTAFGSNATVTGILTNVNGTFENVTGLIPAANTPGDGYALFANNGPSFRTVNVVPSIVPGVGTIYAGGRFYFVSSFNASELAIQFLDAGGTFQCQLNINGSGQALFIGPNNLQLGTGVSNVTIAVNSWNYIEFKAVLSNTSSGICEARFNGITVLTETGLNNAGPPPSGHSAYGPTAAMVFFAALGGSGGYLRDLYVVDGGTGVNTSYLGDVVILEIYPNGVGDSNAWTNGLGSTLSTPPPPPFALTNVTSTNIFYGTITGGAANAYVGYNFYTSGFTNTSNNVSGVPCIMSNASQLVLSVGSVTHAENASANAFFQSMVQIGINKTGTKPNGDVAYIYSNTTNQIQDYTHQALSLSGAILGIEHLSYARKDGGGTASFAQLCNSSGTVELSASLSLGASYQYWIDVLEVDPATSTQFTVSGFNNADFGVKAL